MAYTDRDTANYLGELFLVGQYSTPFLNMIGGLGGNRSKQTRSFTFPVAQPYSLTSASQPAITETQSVTGQTPTTVSRGQDYNTVQIFQKAVEVSYSKLSTYGEISGISQLGDQPVTDELAFQKMAQLRQIAIDAEYSFLNGTYQLGNAATTAAKTRGVITAISTNSVAGGAATLTKAMIDALLLSMVTNGAPLENAVILCNGFQKQKLSSIYGYAPEDRNIGGTNIKQIETDFANLGVVYAPQVPAATLLIADINYCFPVFCPVPGKGLLFYEDKAYVGAAIGGQMFGQIGIDYGPEEFHGKITNLATS